MNKSQKSKVKNQKFKTGFTLIELLVVIAIIGILSGVVMVSTTSATAKAKRASALATASSILPELVICLDDGGNVSAGSGQICSAAGHSEVWPDIAAKTGWALNALAAAPITSAYSFTISKNGETITCSLNTNGCQ